MRKAVRTAPVVCINIGAESPDHTPWVRNIGAESPDHTPWVRNGEMRTKFIPCGLETSESVLCCLFLEGA